MMKYFATVFTFLFVLASANAQEPTVTTGLPPYVTLWQIILSGGWIMIPLGVLSFLGTVLTLVYFFTIRRGAVVTVHFMETAELLIRRGDFTGLATIANRHTEAVAQVMKKTIDFAMHNKNADFAMIREIAESEGVNQASALNQRISYLADVGAIAPMVGLLGTVIGMIRSFSVMASDVAASKPMMLADGVAVALTTTAAGLVIGIPALAFYAFFRGKVQKLIAELESASTHLFALIALHYKREGAVTRNIKAPSFDEL